MIKGEKVEQCLASYPVQAVYLKPLLDTVAVIRRALTTIRPRLEFRVKARYTRSGYPYGHRQLNFPPVTILMG
jgi:hypothetical protein